MCVTYVCVMDIMHGAYAGGWRVCSNLFSYLVKNSAFSRFRAIIRSNTQHPPTSAAEDSDSSEESEEGEEMRQLRLEEEELELEIAQLVSECC